MNRGRIRIAGRDVGSSDPVFVIAEIGVNHDGSIERAIELIRHAADCGADAVKFQAFTGARLMHASARFATYQQDAVDDASPAAMLKRYEFSDEQFADVFAEARRLGLVPLATPFSPEDVDRVAALGAGAFKLASPDLINMILIERCLEYGLPLLLSTGAADAAEIDYMANKLRDRADVVFLHCVSSYPTPADQAHLAWVDELSRLTKGPVGYSDHTTEPLAGALAVAAGACVVEKHLTYDRAAAGPDHAASADPAQFAAYVAAIRLAERLRGRGTRRVLDIERDVREVSRQSLVARVDLLEGTVLAPGHLTCQRPGTGLSVEVYEWVLGQPVTRDIAAGEMLGPDDVVIP